MMPAAYDPPARLALARERVRRAEGLRALMMGNPRAYSTASTRLKVARRELDEAIAEMDGSNEVRR